jgi:hypothetical protein
MADYSIDTSLIFDNDYIGNSLQTINSNFANLKQGICNLESQIAETVDIRTFFYYGPNSPSESEAGVWESDYQATRPSNLVIENFCNNPSQLNLLGISKTGDIAYIVYQRTGWFSQTNVTYKYGSGREKFTFAEKYKVQVTRKIGIGGGKGGGTVTTWEERTRYIDVYSGYTWETNISDMYVHNVPNFVIYKLRHNGVRYAIESGFPKYSRATTSSTENWNKPQLWSTY